MLKQKIDTAALFAQKKTEVQSSARTLLILDGQENAYISADELTEELLAIPEEGAIWLDMSLFGSHDQVMTVARSFKLSPATQNILENKKQQPRLFRDGNNRILICRHLQLNESGNAVYNNICFAASANRLLSLHRRASPLLSVIRFILTTRCHRAAPERICTGRSTHLCAIPLPAATAMRTSTTSPHRIHNRLRNNRAARPERWDPAWHI